MLTQDEKERYARHLALPQIGEQGQSILKQSSVLIVGVGGLGSPIALYLAAAGVGHLGLIDRDTVSESNLQRQVLYKTDQIGLAKCEMAKERLKELNPHIIVDCYQEWLTTDNAEAIFSHYDVVVDATDNLKVRYLMDELCHRMQKPLIYGSICEFKGQISVFNYRGIGRYCDLFPYSEEIINFTQPLGVIGALPGVVGSLQAIETIKVLLGFPSLVNKLLLIDLLSIDFTIIEL